MNYLIDTHVLIWFTEGDSNLPLPIRIMISDPKNNVFVSHASIWEIIIKTTIGKLNLSLSFSDLRTALQKNGFAELPTQFEHFEALAILPLFHQDPFDRLLIAQALAEDFTIITHDPKIQLYPVKLAFF